MARVGIFGGRFNPIHYGHINSLLSVAETLQLSKVLVMPAYQSPLSDPMDFGPTPDERLEMVRLALKEYAPLVHVSDDEIRRGGISYTIDTIHDLLARRPEDQLNLIVGLDQFENFDRWKNVNEILSLVDVVVTSRPGLVLPKRREGLPAGIVQWVADFDGEEAILKTGRTIHFVQLKDVSISATEVRRRVRQGLPIHEHVPSAVELYIHEKRLYESVLKAVGDYSKLLRFAAKVLDEKGALRIIGFDVREIQSTTEFTLVASGSSTRHASALAENLAKEIRKEFGVWPQNTEGQREGRWIVLDYGALIVHVFYDYVRQEYRLEDLWKAAKIVHPLL